MGGKFFPTGRKFYLARMGSFFRWEYLFGGKMGGTRRKKMGIGIFFKAGFFKMNSGVSRTNSINIAGQLRT